MTGRGDERKGKKRKGKKGYCMTPRLYRTVLYCRFRSRSVDRSIASLTKRASSCRWVAGWAGRRAPRVGAHVGCRPSGPWSERKARGTGRLCLLDQGQGLQGQSGRSGAALSLPDSQSSSSSWQGPEPGAPLPRPPSLFPLPFVWQEGRKGAAACCCIRTVCGPSVRVCVCVS